MNNSASNTPNDPLAAETLRTFFITHLNRIYCAKSHLFERLPEIRLEAHFGDLSHALNETMDDVENQLRRMDKIFRSLGVEPGFEECTGMIGLIEEIFTSINGETNKSLSDLSILFYLRQIESIETASFDMLKLAVPGMGQPEIAQLILESFDEAREDLALFRLIAENYFAGNG